jgi:N,N'-diacetyllegionaminate synthase
MNKVIIIAEAGVNHNGNIDLAYKMIDVAKESGADYVKFQTAVPELVYSANTPKAEYQIKSTGGDESQIEMAKKIHLPISAYEKLQDYCKNIDIGFLSTPFDHVSIDALEKLDLDFFKVPSGELTNLPYLEKIAKIGKPIILSTGMAKLGEIEDAIEVIVENGVQRENITVLHCNTEYPTPMQDVNLKAMKTIAKAFGVKVGYSDHTLGIEVPIAAVAMGAVVIEKHYTLDNNMEGPDHLASLNPSELKSMVCAIRNIEKALGIGIKFITNSERKNMDVSRKSIHIAKNLEEGHVLTIDDLIIKRPGNGISPMRIKEFYGKRVKRKLPFDHKLSYNDLEF